MLIKYIHHPEVHSTIGPECAIEAVAVLNQATSILDVGCGTGTWLRAATLHGITDVFGIDGINIPKSELLFAPESFRLVDLTKDWDLGRRFDVALCLEVAEHLPAAHGPHLVQALTAHADTVIFSAAIPGQSGQHHVNCQWPMYWQDLFNERGFVCSDSIRWQLWDNTQIEPWYRQNCMICERDPGLASHEPRIESVVHPEMLIYMIGHNSDAAFRKHIGKIERGALPIRWYLTTPIRALAGKLRRGLGSRLPKSEI
jgi:SAM-dependent methyltransferase